MNEAGKKYSWIPLRAKLLDNDQVKVPRHNWDFKILCTDKLSTGEAVSRTLWFDFSIVIFRTKDLETNFFEQILKWSGKTKEVLMNRWRNEGQFKISISLPKYKKFAGRNLMFNGTQIVFTFLIKNWKYFVFAQFPLLIQNLARYFGSESQFCLWTENHISLVSVLPCSVLYSAQVFVGCIGKHKEGWDHIIPVQNEYPLTRKWRKKVEKQD